MSRRSDAVYAVVTDDGKFAPADQFSRDILRRKKFRRGDSVRLVITKPRNVLQWRRAHALGTLVAQNLDEFQRFAGEDGRIDAHGALKHLQFLSGIECDETRVRLPTGEELLARTPRSLAFDELDEGQFQAAYSGFCQYLINNFWTDMDADAIEQAAGLVGM